MDKKICEKTHRLWEVYAQASFVRAGKEGEKKALYAHAETKKGKRSRDHGTTSRTRSHEVGQ